MSKKKAQSKNRHKKLARKKQQRKAKAAGLRRSVSPKLNPHKKLALEITEFEDSGEYNWWLAHILNMANSDYTEGVWNPLFDIYGAQPTPSLENLQIAVMETHWDQEKKEWKGDSEVIASLLAQSPKTILNLRDVLINRVRESEKDMSLEAAFEEAKKPHQSAVWGYFEEIKAATASGPTREVEDAEKPESDTELD